MTPLVEIISNWPVGGVSEERPIHARKIIFFNVYLSYVPCLYKAVTFKAIIYRYMQVTGDYIFEFTNDE